MYTIDAKLVNKSHMPDSVNSPSNVQSHNKGVRAFFQGVLPLLGEEVDEVSSVSAGPEAKLPVSDKVVSFQVLADDSGYYLLQHFHHH